MCWLRLTPTFAAESTDDDGVLFCCWSPSLDAAFVDAPIFFKCKLNGWYSAVFLLGVVGLYVMFVSMQRA